MPDSSKDRISTVEHIYVTVIILFPNLINKRRKSASLRKRARALQSPGTGLVAVYTARQPVGQLQSLNHDDQMLEKFLC